MAQSAVKWTEEQKKVIDFQGKTLLVSAAAGSGKTAVLVERLMRRVTDDKNPEDIDRFIIVTFTNAAAAEMKAKITARLSDLISDNPANMHLRRQLVLIHKAEISTVHAFCAGLIRNNAAALCVNPEFRICDESEAKIIKNDIADNLLFNSYAADKENAQFFELVEAFSDTRGDERLRNVIIATYNALQSSADPDSWLERQRHAFETDPNFDFGGTEQGCSILKRFKRMLEYYLTLYGSLISEMSRDGAIYEKYAPVFSADMEGMRWLLERTASGGWNAIAEAASLVFFDRLPPIRKCGDEELKERAQAARNEYKAEIIGYAEGIFAFGAGSNESIAEDIEAVRPAAQELFRLVSEFGSSYAKEKRRREQLDYNDLERLALGLLTKKIDKKTGEITPSDVALALSSRIAEVMVDEYQDTNDVQDAIFRALTAGPAGLFMVGDVKQSIYRFREANPGIFLRRYLEYKDVEMGEEPEARQILGRNFRSRAGVLDFINHVFAKLMSRELGELDYTEREALYPGAQYVEKPGPEARFFIIDRADTAETEDDALAEINSAELEAAFIAAKARELLDSGFTVTDKATGQERPARPGDIVVLLRSMKGKAQYYEAALTARGIPTRADESESLLEAPEVAVIVAYLNVIDNPHQDIALIGVMRSPLYAFTADELAKIRLADKEVSFYKALMKSAEEGMERASRFLSELHYFRKVANDIGAAELIWRIYDRTAAPAVFGSLEGGAQRRANLIALFFHARRLESAGYGGLFAFTSYLRRLLEKGSDISAPPSVADSGDCVRIMSIHKSKGLEFPVVILADTAKQFNREDLREPVLISRELGAGFKRRDAARGIEYPTAGREAISARLTDEMLSEELRVLYVALTRAKERLIITGALRGARATIEKLAALSEAERPEPYAASRLRCPAEWLILALGGANAWKPEIIPAADIELPKNLAKKEATKAPEPDEEQKKQIADRIKYRYLYPLASRTASKLTATSLKGRFLDEEAASSAGERDKMPPPVYKRPRFITGAQGLTSAERGVAQHLYMQFTDFERCATFDGARGELERLVSREQLTRQQAQAVDPRRISAFFQSTLGKRMLASPEVRREFKFSLLVPAGEYYPELGDGEYEGERVLLQGVIDCWFIEAGELIIIDFKTDAIDNGEEAQRAEQYRPQVGTYARALSEITGRPVKAAYLYFLKTDTEVKVI